jgi:hypothetical protein
MVDSGSEGDRYSFAASTGMGVADYSGWGLFIDEGGDDHYESKGGFGRASERGVAAFFDLRGHDSYELADRAVTNQEQRPSDAKAILYPSGGLFVDR